MSLTVEVFTSDQMPEDRYLDDPAPAPSLSSSMAKILINRSPAHAYHYHPRLGNGRQPTKWSDQKPGTRRGTMVHAAILGSSRQFPVIMDLAKDKKVKGDPEGRTERERDGHDYARDWKKKAVQQARDDALARGEHPILFHEQEETAAITDVLKGQLDERGLFSDKGRFEYTVMWQADTHYGPIWCRSRLDHWEERDGQIWISDLKTTRDASEDACERAIRQYLYHVQQAAYTEAITMAFPGFGGRVRFRFVFVELEPLPLVHVVPLGNGFREIGQQLWRRAKHIWGRCLSTNDWHGYPHETIIDARDWYLAQHGGF